MPQKDSSVQQKKRVVVIGGGFAGLNMTKYIDTEYYDVIIIDRNNYHSFPPLFYQVASAGLDPASISFPLRRELRKLHTPGVTYRMGDVVSVDVNRKEVVTRDEKVHYDILVIAAGTTNNFFNMPELEKSVYTLKSTPEALRCRNDILDILEHAALERDPARQRAMLHFVVVGGGPTGVEIAGALGEMKRYVLPREYPTIPQEHMKITLVEGTGRLLSTMSEKSSDDARKGLESLMVDIRLGAVMKKYVDRTVIFSDGSNLPATLLIWTAGVTAVPIRIEGVPEPVTGRGKRFLTDGYCRVKGLEDVYAIGDISLMPDADPAFPQGHPQLAQVAIQQGRLVARNLSRMARAASIPGGGNTSELALKTFVYKDKGSMATIGRNRAVVDMPHAHMSGFLAWLTWMAVHLMSLLGMRNKITVLINWIWAYCNYSTSLRILIHSCRYPLRARWLDTHRQIR